MSSPTSAQYSATARTSSAESVSPSASMRAGPGIPCRTAIRARARWTEPSRVSPRARPCTITASAPAASWAVACPWVWAAHSTASWRTSWGSQPTSSPKGAERVSAAESRAAGFLGTASVPIVESPKPARHSLVGERRVYSHSSLASQPLSLRRSSGPQALWVAAQRRCARCTSVGGCQAPVSRRTWARISPSTVKSVSCVTAVTAPRRPCAGTKSATPSAPWTARIASRVSPETPAPSASPMAPPSRDPRTRPRKSCCWARPQTAVVPVVTVPPFFSDSQCDCASTVIERERWAHRRNAMYGLARRSTFERHSSRYPGPFPRMYPERNSRAPTRLGHGLGPPSAGAARAVPAASGPSAELAGLVVPGRLPGHDVQPVVGVDHGDEGHQGEELVLVVVLGRVGPRLVRDPARRVGDARALLGQLQGGALGLGEDRV